MHQVPLSRHLKEQVMLFKNLGAIRDLPPREARLEERRWDGPYSF